MRVEKIFNRTLLAISLIVVLGVIAYSNTFHVPFIFDDHTSITGNPVIKNLKNFFVGTSGYDYNPRRFLPYLSFAVNFHFDGLNVVGYHLFNLAVHIGCALLVYTLLRLTFRTPYFQDKLQASRFKLQSLTSQPSTFIPLLTALLFVAHPVQTQAVTYIVQRMTSLATFFYLLSLILYIQARLRLGTGVQGAESQSQSKFLSPLLLLAGAVFSAVLAMRSKEIAFTLPFAVLLYETFFFQGKWKRRLFYLAPLLLTLPIIPFSLLTTGARTGELLSDVDQAARVVGSGIPRLHYLFTQFRVLVTYLRLLILPVNQNLDYDYPVYASFFTPPVFLSFLLLAALFALAIYLYFRTRQSPHSTLNSQPSTFNQPALRLVSFGILWFFLALAVESSLIPIPDVIYEHRLYLPSVGAFTAAAAGLWMVIDRARKPALALSLTAMAAAVVLLLTAATWQRNQIWRSAASLWQDVAAKSPKKARPYLSLGAALGKEGRMEEAIAALRRGIRLSPDDPKPYINLGAALASTGRLQEAAGVLSKVLKLEPDNPEALNNLGIILTDLGRSDEATGLLSRATRVDPENARAWYNLGRADLQAGHAAEAMTALQRAIRIRPGYDNARVELANALNRQGRCRETKALLEPELKRLANRPDVHLALGMAAHCLGDMTTAERELAVLQRLNPRYARQLADRMGQPAGAGAATEPKKSTEP